MIGIPEQLKNYEFLYLVENDKIPVAGEATHRTYEEALQHPWNVGVLMSRGLYVVDIDNVEVAKQLRIGDLLETTFIVQSNRGYHFYYTDPDMYPHGCSYSHKGEHFVDIRASENTYVVAPPSVHPSGAVYSVYNDFEIAYQPLDDLREKLDKVVGKRRWSEVKSSPINVKVDFDMSDIIHIPRSAAESKDGYNFENPWHGSTSGKNFLVFRDGHGWYCRRCECQGNAVKALALKLHIIHECSDFMTKDQYIQTMREAEKLGLVQPRGTITEKPVEHNGTIQEQ